MPADGRRLAFGGDDWELLVYPLQEDILSFQIDLGTASSALHDCEGIVSNHFDIFRGPACIYRRLQPLLLTLHSFGVTLHLFYKPISLPVLPILELNPIFQPALLLAILEQANVALQALLPAILPDLLHKPLEPLRLPVSPSSPILVLSKLRPVPPLLLKYILYAVTNGNPVRDDICVISRLIQEVEVRLAWAVGRSPAILNQITISLVFSTELLLAEFF
jgi:hypothetical protein